MGLPLPVFSLYRLQDEGLNCSHYLLLRVEQAAFSNADQQEYDAAVEAADRKKSNLTEFYTSRMLARECAGHHVVSLIGELQSYPCGGPGFDGCGGFYLDLWVAETRFGHPWVVMGTGESEEDFWCGVEGDEELAGLAAVRPAGVQRAYFLTEQNE